MLSKKEQELLCALEPRAAQEQVEIVTIEIVGSRKSPTIRVYIDTDKGVGFDELSCAQAWINDIVDALDPFPGAYVLEVSSPGIDRPLRTPEHFARFAGEQVVIKTTEKIDGRASFSGTLTGISGDEVLVSAEQEAFRIPLAAIKRANVKGTIDFHSK